MLEVLAPSVFKNRAFKKIIKFKQMYECGPTLIDLIRLIRGGKGIRELSPPLTDARTGAHREKRTQLTIRGSQENLYQKLSGLEPQS